MIENNGERFKDLTKMKTQFLGTITLYQLANSIRVVLEDQCLLLPGQAVKEMGVSSNVI
jgi:hypothetical protein